MRSPRTGSCDRSLRSLWLLGLAWALASCSPSSSGPSGSRRSVRINEMMALNRTVDVLDEGGRRIEEDWVELYNFGDAEVSLAGYGLTDDPNRPGKFRFPSGSRLAPGAFVVVYVFDRADCLIECEDDFEDCLVERERECNEAFEDCMDAGDADCDRELSECLEDQADCEADLAECMTDCDPFGFVADFGFGANDTIYLFDGETEIDRLGVRTPPERECYQQFDDCQRECYQALDCQLPAPECDAALSECLAAVTPPGEEPAGSEAVERFTEVSVGRYPDGTGAYGVHHAGATPGEPNVPIDVGAPSLSGDVAGPARDTLDCFQTLTVSFNVIADSDALESLDPEVEYADASCDDDVSEDQWTEEGVTVQDLAGLEVDPEERVNVEGEPVFVPRTLKLYEATVPGGQCGVERHVRVRIRQGGRIFITEGVTDGHGCVTFTPR